MQKTMSPGLDKLFDERSKATDDMAGHMVYIRNLVRGLGDCAEFGVRRANSTVALLAGCSGKVHSYDVERLPRFESYLTAIEKVAGGRWDFNLQSSLKATLPPCDALIIDSLHNYDHIKAELDRHGDGIRKYLIFHDSMSCGCWGQSSTCAKSKPNIIGIRPAIDHFMIDRKGQWEIIHHDVDNSGLLVIERVKQCPTNS